MNRREEDRHGDGSNWPESDGIESMRLKPVGSRLLDRGWIMIISLAHAEAVLARHAISPAYRDLVMATPGVAERQQVLDVFRKEVTALRAWAEAEADQLRKRRQLELEAVRREQAELLAEVQDLYRALGLEAPQAIAELAGRWQSVSDLVSRWRRDVEILGPGPGGEFAPEMARLGAVVHAGEDAVLEVARKIRELGVRVTELDAVRGRCEEALAGIDPHAIDAWHVSVEVDFERKGWLSGPNADGRPRIGDDLIARLKEVGVDIPAEVRE